MEHSTRSRSSLTRPGLVAILGEDAGGVNAKAARPALALAGDGLLAEELMDKAS